MLERLSPEQLEAWKQKRRGLDTSIHLVLEDTAQPEHEGALTHLLTGHVLHHHDPENPRREDRDTAPPKRAPLPKIHLRHTRHAA